MGMFDWLTGPQTVTTTSGFDPLTEQVRSGVLTATQAAAGTPGSPGRPMPQLPSWIPASLRAEFERRWNADPRNQARPATPGSVTGLDPDTQRALDLFGGYADAGRAGIDAFTGGDTSRFTNPYQSQVIEQIRNQFGLLNDAAQTAVNSRFTRAGSFGGSRQGVAAGQAAADVANNLGNQIAGFQYQGFNDAMGRALQSANLGFGAGQQLAALGPYAQIMNDPNLRQAYLLRMMSQGLPVGTTSTAPNPNYRSIGQIAVGAIPFVGGLFGGGAPAGQQSNWGGGYSV